MFGLLPEHRLTRAGEGAAEKRQQMHAPSDMWPRRLPCEVADVWNMPIVLWLWKGHNWLPW